MSPAIRKEAVLFIVFLFVGIVLLPLAIFFVGQLVFGTFGGAGYADFLGSISARIRGLDGVAWFLVLSPYLALQCLRLTIRVWRWAGRPA